MTHEIPARTPLLEVEALKMHFPVRSGLLRKVTGHVRAVDGVSLAVHEGETLGVVGESGCGKSTTGRLMTRLLTPTEGTIRLRGKDVTRLEGAELRRMRREVQIVFQDPYSSLDPRQSAGDIVIEPMTVHGIGRPRERRAKAEDLFQRVGLRVSDMAKFPREFSGGQRQRIGIARALALDPKVIVCDEPVSALDVSIQAQVVNLLTRLQRELGIAYVFIAHDLGVVHHISDRIAVMYLGRVVEIADRQRLFKAPRHPYTQALLSAVPMADPAARGRKRVLLEGDVPSPVKPPSGCRFHTRCPFVFDRCRTEDPAFRDMGAGQKVACHLMDDPAGPAGAGKDAP